MIPFLCLLSFVLGDNVDVLVVGGGPAGLSTGYFLKKAGIRFRILEMESNAGGRVRSDVYNGVKYGKGTEYLGQPSGALKAIIDTLGIQMMEIPSPMDASHNGSMIFYGFDGHLKQKKDEGVSMIQMQDLLDDVKDAEEKFESDVYSNMQALDDKTMKQWLVDLGEPEVFQYFKHSFNVSSKGLFGANIDEISSLCYLPEEAFNYNDVTRAQIASWWPELENNQTACFNEKSGAYTGANGVISDITDGLAAYLKNELLLNSEVYHIQKTNGGYYQYDVTYENTTEEEDYTIHTRFLVIATDGPKAFNLTESMISQPQKDFLSQVYCSEFVTVSLFSDIGPLFEPPAFDLAVPDGYFFTDIYDLSWTYRLSNADLADKPGSSSMMGIYVSPQVSTDISLSKMSDVDIVNAVYADLAKLYPGAEENVTSYVIERFECGYPIYKPGMFKKVRDFVKSYEEEFLLFAGDFVSFPTLESAVESGKDVADCVIEMITEVEDDDKGAKVGSAMIFVLFIFFLIL